MCNEIWSKEEYAEIHWNGIKHMICELDNSDVSDKDKMQQLYGYIESYIESSDKLKYEYELR